jgi:hypothetical protein
VYPHSSVVNDGQVVDESTSKINREQIQRFVLVGLIF